MTPVYVPRDPNEKAMQRALMHYFKPYNRELVTKALKKAHREDLIGWGPDCLIPPYERKPRTGEKSAKGKKGGIPGPRREAPAGRGSHGGKKHPDKGAPGRAKRRG